MQEQSDHPCDLKVVAYITAWCPDCTRSRRVLQRLGVPFAELDIEKIPGSEEAMRSVNGGTGKVPTILIEGPGGHSILIEPGDRELTDAVRTCSGGSSQF
jgi:mycoredoxin